MKSEAKLIADLRDANRQLANAKTLERLARESLQHALDAVENARHDVDAAYAAIEQAAS